jgi:hypothetical protein
MFLKKLIVLALISLLAGWGTSSATAETLFFDDFEDGTISKAFKLETTQRMPGKPTWVEKDGILSQTSDKQGDPAYAVIADKKYPKALTIQAKVRIDTWQDGDTARGGVGVRVGWAGLQPPRATMMAKHTNGFRIKRISFFM